jgi:predicted transcriptional regulator
MSKKLPSGELENQVLEILWSQGRPMTPRDVHDVLSADRTLAYTTAMTILVRLCEKGLVDRERSGRAFAYRPVLSREERAALRMGEVLATAGDHSAALSRFVEALPERERAQLRDALRAASGGS